METHTSKQNPTYPQLTRAVLPTSDQYLLSQQRKITLDSQEP